jgi:hypothetical protein
LPNKRNKHQLSPAKWKVNAFISHYPAQSIVEQTLANTGVVMGAKTGNHAAFEFLA